MSFNVAIDGPAGAGKSTVAKAVAAKRNFIYVDTGAMYRAMALFLLRRGLDPKNQKAVEEECRQAQISLAYEDGAQQVILNGENVTGLIRTEEVGNMASATSVYMPVREKLVQLQQELAARENVIMDGRDIGTVVLPHAQLKIFLTASPEERARRRFRELIAKDPATDYNQVLAEIKQRDYQDSHREIAPLKPAEDAVYVDTSDLNLEQSVDKVTELIKERISCG